MGSDEVALTIVNVGQVPCELVVFIIDDVNGPVDPVALPVRDGRVDFESTDFFEMEAAEVGPDSRKASAAPGCPPGSFVLIKPIAFSDRNPLNVSSSAPAYSPLAKSR